MPCDGAWPSERVELFRRWMDTGMRETASDLVPEAAGPAESSGASAASVEAIEGRLRRVLDLRSEQYVRERAIVIEHRGPLIYMLCEAAELEHAVMCEYLFAAFSLKRSFDEGLTHEQLAAVERWRSTILGVAKQEMLHLAIACNLLTSIGVSPHLSRPNLPQPARHYPSGVRFELLPFGEQALRHFLFLERPEGMDLNDAEGVAAMENAVPVTGNQEIAPHLQEFRTVGHLYRSIEAGFRHLAEKMGEENLFLGPAGSQTRGELFGWKELGPISSTEEAVRAIEAIVEQGEGSRGDWRNAHFGRFLSVLTEYLQMRQNAPGLEVTRPVLPVLVRPPETGEEVTLITDPATARVADLCNVAYEVLLHVFYRLMSRIDESADQIGILAAVAVGIMNDVIGPLARHPQHHARRARTSRTYCRSDLRAVLPARLPSPAPQSGLARWCGASHRRGGHSGDRDAARPPVRTRHVGVALTGPSPPGKCSLTGTLPRLNREPTAILGRGYGQRAWAFATEAHCDPAPSVDIRPHLGAQLEASCGAEPPGLPQIRTTKLNCRSPSPVCSYGCG